MLKSVFTLFEWSCGKVGYDGLLDLSMDFILFKFYFAAFSIASLWLLINLMISTINEVFTEVRENELYSYDKELVDFAKGLFRDAGKIITGKYDDDDDDDKKKVSFEFDDDDVTELNLTEYKDGPEYMETFEHSMGRLFEYINSLETKHMSNKTQKHGKKGWHQFM